MVWQNTNRKSVRFQKTNNQNNSLNHRQIGLAVCGAGGILLLSGIVVKSFVIGAVGGAAMIAGGIVLFSDEKQIRRKNDV